MRGGNIESMLHQLALIIVLDACLRTHITAFVPTRLLSILIATLRHWTSISMADYVQF